LARYRGPDSKLVRNAGVSESEIPKAAKLKRKYPTGQHGQERKKLSEYALQLREKQRIKLTYGLLEKQFYRNVQEAMRQKGVTGTLLLQRLESRLDNILFRSGLVKTRRQGRQLIVHGHLLLNGKKVDIPSYILKPGDVVHVCDKSKELFKNIQEGRSLMAPDWLETDFDQLAVKFKSRPERDEIDRTFNEQLIIEFYSR
jgi:small subunit ribosomal protein S4